MSAGERAGEHPGRRRGRPRWWPGRSAAEAHAAAEGAERAADEAERARCTPIRDCAEGPAGRPVVSVTGTLRSVSERTVAGLPALAAELDDGSARLEVVWLGRAAIAGIVPGRELVASGRIALAHGRPVLFNPRYQLRPLDKE
ncbi:OB-fold nucleic acid binding domain-containing protein [Streptomyces sp. JH002]|uniref:OB-fold tRNA/helicase-type nucleic acid binding protein n=1 Tax=Streptomyces xiamenensis TaxID=408015 RepID=A0A0F7FYX1_9ACTN|nr:MULTISPECIES: OB-fold nucleic acid binding domain-containing protein [Streptomyces]AKG45983.1 OB-fold tRNA/helicase-type nucleic acid binding protein [Streptomyces xiamenensis]